MRARPTCAGFTPIEMVAVLAVIGVLVALVGVSVTSMIASARRDTALGQVATVFRAAQTAALATNQERRVVVRVTYPILETSSPSLSALYEAGIRVDFWVERKVNPALDNWDPTNYSEPLDDPQTLPAGVQLVDIDGRAVIPTGSNAGKNNGDGTQSYYICFVYAEDGQITTMQRTSRAPNAQVVSNSVVRNPALHFMFSGTVLDLGEVGGDIDYLSLILPIDSAPLTAPNPELARLLSNVNQEYEARPQVHTLYLLRLTGQTVAYDYGIHYPWPRMPLPDTFEGQT
ncbi:MAG: hypothetical protein GHCLOJNM_02969 [bacterium]|nr:hypothetical protein [bacterium]